jgi:DUF4097 and DUF4098 domain-containing protein YvlB
MTSLVCIGMLLLSVGAVAATVTEEFDQTVALAPGGSVSLENINGDVVVETWERDEVRVQATKTASSQELLDGLEIEISTTANSVQIDTEYPSYRSYDREMSEHGKREMKVEYTLTVPRTAAIADIELVNGSLAIDGVEGGITAETVNGSIAVKRSAGAFDLSTVNGSVELWADRLASDDDISMESVNGSLDLYLSGSIGADIEAESVNGRLANDFGIDVRKGKYVGSDFSGSIGGGGSHVGLETVNGTIAVHSW